MDFESVTATTVFETFLLLLIGIRMVFGREDPAAGNLAVEGKEPLQLATVPLVVPYLLNPAGIVPPVTVSPCSSRSTVRRGRRHRTDGPLSSPCCRHGPVAQDRSARRRGEGALLPTGPELHRRWRNTTGPRLASAVQRDGAARVRCGVPLASDTTHRCQEKRGEKCGREVRKIHGTKPRTVT